MSPYTKSMSFRHLLLFCILFQTARGGNEAISSLKPDVRAIAKVYIRIASSLAASVRSRISPSAGQSIL